MNSRERVIRTLKFEEVDRIPRHLWTLPAITMYRNNELNEVLEKYPGDFGALKSSYGTGKRSKGNYASVGQYTDAWGCEWFVGEPGVVGEVKKYPLEDWSALDQLKQI